MRDRIWNHLANVKFKAFYTDKCSTRFYHISNLISFVLAIASTGSVATWALWNKFPWIWSFIVAISQLLHVAKHHLPYLKYERDLIEMSIKYDDIYLKYEMLWYDYEQKKINGIQAEENFYKLRQNENKLENDYKTVRCPEIKGIIKKAHLETLKSLKLHFS